MHALMFVGIALLGLATNAIVQFLFHRFLLPHRLASSLLIGFGAGIAVSLTGVLVVVGDLAMGRLAWYAAGALVIYLACSFAFICLIAAAETSVRLEILRALKAPYGLTRAELLLRYNDSILLGRRLSRLRSMGAIELNRGRYYSRSRILVIVANCFRIGRICLYGFHSEFNEKN